MTTSELIQKIKEIDPDGKDEMFFCNQNDFYFPLIEISRFQDGVEIKINDEKISYQKSYVKRK